MKRRCENPGAHAYERYGGRGISVASEFKTFQGFFAYLGSCPPGFTLDRIDNDGNYEPGNVRWTDRKTQGRNKRNNHVIALRGKRQPLSAWAEELGITWLSLLSRLETGWPVEEALTLPKGSQLPDSQRQALTPKQSAKLSRKSARAAQRAASRRIP